MVSTLFLVGPAKRRHGWRRPVLAALLALLSGSALLADEEAARSWAAVSQLQWGEMPLAPAARAAQLAEALVWSAGPKRSDANDARAAARLHDLAAGDDEVALAARYHGARLQLFRGDSEAGRAGLQQLAAEAPRSRYGQLARLKLATHELAVVPAASALAALERHGQGVDELPDLIVRRALHLLLGETYLRFELAPAVALRHLAAASALGLESYNARVNTGFRLAVLAERTGDADAAALAFERFAATFPFDTRATLARERARLLREEAQP